LTAVPFSRLESLLQCIILKGCIYSLDWTTGLDYWTGTLDWNTGLDYWTGTLDWTTGLTKFLVFTHVVVG